MKNRFEHIDIAKGISIILVALAHSQLKLFAPDVVDSMALFRMPLFFFLSGVFFSISDKPKTFLIKKSDALLKPYFTTMIILFILWIAIKQQDLGWHLKGIFYGNGNTMDTHWIPMWFLTHLFVVYCSTYFIFTISHIQQRQWHYKLATLILLMTIGCYWIDAFTDLKLTLLGKSIYLDRLPFSLDLILISSSFFMFGAFFKNRIIHFKPNLSMLLTSVLLFLAIVVFTNTFVDLYERIHVNSLLATIGALCGIYFVLCASFYLCQTKKIKQTLLIFGQASLFVLIFHNFIGYSVYRLFAEQITNETSLWYAIAAFVISITAPLAIRFIVINNRLLSFIYLPLKLKEKKEFIANQPTN